MTEQKKKEIRVFWWGRVLPKEYKHLSRLGASTDEDFEILDNLKRQWAQAQNEGLSLDWGQQWAVDDYAVRYPLEEFDFG